MIEKRRAELHSAGGRRIVGRAMRYGAEAVVRMRDGSEVRERFAAFAFSEYLRRGGPTRLNLMHDRSIELASTGAGNLVLQDGPGELRMVAVLPGGAVYDKALALVADGSTAETSVEFNAIEQRIEGDKRTVLAATLPGIGLVDSGAYGSAGAVELRREGQGLAGRVPYGVARVTADRGVLRKQMFRAGAFDEALRDETREILVQLGDDAGQVLASRRAGTLTLADTAEALTFEIASLPDTSYAADFAALLDAGAIAPGVLPFFRIPPADVVPDATERIPDPDNPGVEIEVLHNVLLTALSIRYRAPRGNPGEIERRNHRDRERARTERSARGRRFWL